MKKYLMILLSLTFCLITFSADTFATPTDQKYEGLPIKEIQVVGAVQTQVPLIKKQSGLKEGDLFSTQKLQLAEDRLKSIGSLGEITLHPQLTESNEVLVFINLVEGSPLARTSADYINLALEPLFNQRLALTYYNLAGRLVNLTGLWGFKNDEENALNHERTLQLQGALFPTLPVKSTLAFSKYDTYRHLTWGQYSNSTYRFTHQRVHLQNELLAFTDSKFHFKLTFSQDRLTDFDSLFSRFLIEAKDYLEVETEVSQRTPPTEHLGTYDVVNYGKLGLLIDLTDSLHTFPYFTVMRKQTLPLAPKWNLALDANLGWMDKSTPYHRQFVLGKPETFSAYPESLIGTRYLFVGSELRYYLLPNLQITGEVSGGKILQESEPYHLTNPILCLGSVLRYQTPFDLAVEVGYATDPLAGRSEFILGGTLDF